MVLKGRFLCALGFLALCLSFSVSATGNYTYTEEGKPMKEPSAYEIQTVVDGANLGCGRFNEPTDVFVAEDGSIYIADSGNNRIVALKDNLELSHIVDGFVGSDGKNETFHKPEGIFATADKLYVADTGNKRIVCLTTDGTLIREYPEPEIDLRYEDNTYQPIRICVDSAERMFVISRNDNNGVIELDKEGKFNNYFGAPQTQLSFMDLFWNKVMTQEQLDNSAAFVPIEFSSEDIDSQGFIYTTAVTPDLTADRILRRINPAGYNILRSFGRYPPIGDLSVTDEKGNTLNSQLVDVCVDENGIYSVLDQFRGRVFTYDTDGNMLYVFGEMGKSNGEMSMPRALDKTVDNRFLIADMQLGRVLVYAPTAYAQSINQAVLYQKNREYEKAEEEWKNILSSSSNFDIAYIGVGKSLLRQGDYKQAMEYFKKGGDRTLYSKAMGYYRKQMLDGSFPYILLTLVGLIALFVITKVLMDKYKARQTATVHTVHSPFNGGIKYAFHIITHPVDGFWCAKAEKRANMRSAWFILFFVILTTLLSSRLTGFCFSGEDNDNNILTQILGVLIPLFMWCIANWCITTLLDGKGTMKDIFILTVYSLVPFVLLQMLMIVLSNVLTLEEAQLYGILNILSLVWSALLMFIGLIVVHEYTIKKAVLTIIIAIIGMAAMAFLFILFFSLIQQFINFSYIFYKELTLGI